MFLHGIAWRRYIRECSTIKCTLFLPCTCSHLYIRNPLPSPDSCTLLVLLNGPISPKSISKYYYSPHFPSSTPPTAVTLPPPSVSYSPPSTPPHVPSVATFPHHHQRSPDRPTADVVGGIDGVNPTFHHLVLVVVGQTILLSEQLLHHRHIIIQPRN
jgi:hypothetical protein